MAADGPDYAAMEDARLAGLFRSRDAGAVRFIATRHNQRLFRAAWAVLRDNAEAEDAVQNAYLKAFAAIDGFEGRSMLSTWLTRIVINEALTRRRSALRRARLTGDAGAAAAAWADTASSPADQPETPEQHVANTQLHHRLQQALNRLPEKYRTVFVLREVEGMSVDETAVALAILPATVKTRAFRARQMLQADLAAVDRTALDGFLVFAGEACGALTARLAALVAPQPPRA
ncbi:MAG: RNA polymerase sigma factor [Beijerinckiaceae bacterium]|nr:RNA polymerase sigma factor [Beijerinckiaceae bacterium]